MKRMVLAILGAMTAVLFFPPQIGRAQIVKTDQTPVVLQTNPEVKVVLVQQEGPIVHQCSEGRGPLLEKTGFVEYWKLVPDPKATESLVLRVPRPAIRRQKELEKDQADLKAQQQDFTERTSHEKVVSSPSPDKHTVRDVRGKEKKPAQIQADDTDFLRKEEAELKAEARLLSNEMARKKSEKEIADSWNKPGAFGIYLLVEGPDKAAFDALKKAKGTAMKVTGRLVPPRPFPEDKRVPSPVLSVVVPGKLEDVRNPGIHPPEFVVHSAIPELLAPPDPVESVRIDRAWTLTIKHAGAYVARGTVTYRLNGKTVSQETGRIAAGRECTFRIPENATDERLHLECLVTLTKWRDIINTSVALAARDRLHAKIGGTTLNPWCEMTP